MTRKRTILFLGILLALLLVPTVLPYLIGHLLLPFWAYLLYAFIILVNAGIYLANRLWLIDRFFIQGRVGAFSAWNLALLLAGVVLEILVLDLSGGATVGEGVTVSSVLGIGTVISQRVFVPVLGFLMVLIALAVALSDEWRLAAFKYREAQQRNERLGRDIDSLKGQVDALRRREAAPAADSIAVKVDLVMTKVPLDDILYVKADGDYIVIHKTDGKTLMTLMTLKTLEKQLPYDRFCRTHRSWIVNADKVRGIRDGKILVADAVIPLSDSCKAAFFELLSHKSIVLRTE
ncbi:MAG: LytTR family transcriptional regulator DNA-binding domain-containing protein [Bacteroidales bacterium]|nr:LytTR family transcriptional regulator DNA-binding domain-containing protein [Bacteroidales bacterium]